MSDKLTNVTLVVMTNLRPRGGLERVAVRLALTNAAFEAERATHPGALTFGPETIRALACVNDAFPGAKVVGFRKASSDKPIEHENPRSAKYRSVRDAHIAEKP